MIVRNDFRLGEKAVWDDNAPSELAEEHGEGPFDIVGLRLLDEEEIAEKPDAHPLIVTIQLAPRKRRDFSGGWLARAAASA